MMTWFCCIIMRHNYKTVLQCEYYNINSTVLTVFALTLLTVSTQHTIRYLQYNSFTNNTLRY